MKKTNSMRVAVAMLALTLITSCFVGGTFAKYTTSASGNDFARVAKFGVEIDAGKSAFLDKYEVADAENAKFDGNYSVASSNGDKVVAPGTRGTIDLFTLSGTPEVAVKVDVEMSDIESIYLKKISRTIYMVVNTESWDEVFFITDMSTGNTKPMDIPDPDDQETLKSLYDKRENELNDSWGGPDNADKGNPIKKVETDAYEYYPIVWSLIKNSDEATPVATGSLADIKAYIDENINGNDFEPGTNLADEIGGSYKLTWSWPFDVDDEKDTLLGDLGAGSVELSEYDYKYNLNEAFNFSITVTQID